MMRSPNWSSKILKEETVTSTNDRLAELCQEKEIKEFTTLMAEYQTAGKGQRGNSWESEYGKNLTFSTVFYPQTIAPASQFIFNQYAGYFFVFPIDIIGPFYLQAICMDIMGQCGTNGRSYRHR